MTSRPRRDHYQILAVEREASAAVIRNAFRKRLLELHPDKVEGSKVEPLADGDDKVEALDAVMRAFEVLSRDERREDYDRALETRERHERPLSRLKHVTESERPVDRARAIFFLLVEERPAEARDRLHTLDEDPVTFMSRHLEPAEVIDAAFLFGEFFEQKEDYFGALGWYQSALNLEQGRRRHRPCFSEILERTKRILIHRIRGDLEPRTRLAYLARAEKLGLDRAELGEVEKRRAQVYIELDMLSEAAIHLRRALRLQPQLKGIQRLEERLADYL